MKAMAVVLLALTLASEAAHAARSTAQEKRSRARGDEAEDVDVSNIKEKYWARGDESELGVVQNRLYSKEGKVEIGAFGGLLASDPFLNVQAAGVSIGYHFSEYFALHAFGWKSFVSPSSALLTFQTTRGATTNTNEPRHFLGGEVAASILYGKLSLMGKKIIYYDFHVLGGGGVTSTENGGYVTPFLGLGQQVYLNEFTSLKIDYRLMPYNEQIKEKVIPTRIGEVVGERVNWTSAVTLGLTFLIGGSRK